LFLDALRQIGKSVSCAELLQDGDNTGPVITVSDPTFIAKCELLSTLALAEPGNGDAPGVEVIDRIVAGLAPVSQSVANGTISDLNSVVDGLVKGRISGLIDLSVVPARFCRDLGLAESSCEVPSCLVPPKDPSAESLSLCPPQANVSGRADLRDAIGVVAKQWNLGCKDETGRACLPIDAVAVAARSYLVGPGAVILRRMADEIQRRTAPQSVGDLATLIQQDMSCRRVVQAELAAAGTLIANADTFAIPLDQRNQLQDARRAAFSIFDGAIWQSRQQCENSETATLARVLEVVLSIVAESQIHAPSKSGPTNGNENSGCEPISDQGEFNYFEFLPTGTAAPSIKLRVVFDRPLRRTDPRPNPNVQVASGTEYVPARVDLMLPLADAAPGAARDPMLCNANYLSSDLGIRLNAVGVREGRPFKLSRIGQGDTELRRDVLVNALSKLFDLEPIGLTVDEVDVPTSIVPLQISLKLSLPSFGDVSGLKLLIDPTKPDYGLSSIGSREKLAGIINEFLSKQTITVLGLSLRDITLDVNAFVKSRMIRIRALARSSAIDDLLENDSLPVIAALDPDGSWRLETQALADKAVDRLKAILLPIVSGPVLGTIADRLDGFERHVAVENILQEGGAIKFRIVVSLFETSRIEIPIHVDPSANLSASVAQALNASIKSELASAAKEYVARQLKDAAAQALLRRDSLVAAIRGSHISFLGATLAAEDITQQGELTFSLTNSNPRFRLRGVRLKPNLSANMATLDLASFDFSDATLDGSLSGWFSEKIPKSEYLKITLDPPTLNHGRLHVPITATLPGFSSPILLSYDSDPWDVTVNAFVNELNKQLIAKLIEQLGTKLVGSQLTIGDATLSVSSIDGSAGKIGLVGTVDLQGVFKCKLHANIYPALKVATPDCLQIGGALGALLQLPLGGIDNISPSIDPLEVSFDVKFSELLSSNYLPTIHLVVPAKGKIRISDPLTIKLPLDFTVGIFAFANPAIEIFVNQNQKFGLRGDFTFVSRLVSYIFRVAAHIVGNLDKKQLDLDGGVYLLSFLDLFTLQGHMEVGERNYAEGKVSTGGAIKGIIDLEGNSVIDADVCRLTQKSTLKVLGISGGGSLVVQIVGCKSSDGSECRPRPNSQGAVCVDGDFDLLLGRAGGRVELPLALRAPTLSAKVDALGRLGTVEVRASDAFAKASFGVLGFSFTVIVPSLSELSPDLLERIVENALKPSLDLHINREIVFSTFRGNSKSDGDPSNSRQQANNADNQNSNKDQSSNKDNQNASPTNGQPTRPGAAQNSQSSPNGGQSEQYPWDTGEWLVSFLEVSPGSNLFRRRWTSASKVTRDDDWVISLPKRNVLRDPAVLAYNRYVVSEYTTQKDAYGMLRNTAYQVFFGSNCESGVCALVMDDEDGPIYNLGGRKLLSVLVNGAADPAAYIKEHKKEIGREVYGALQHLALMSVEPEHYGSLEDIVCLKSKENTGACDAIEIKKVFKDGQKGRTIFGPKFDQGIKVEAESFTAWAIDAGLTGRALEIINSDLSPLVVAADDKSYLVQFQSEQTVLVLFNKELKAERSVGQLTGPLLVGVGCNSRIERGDFENRRGLVEMLLVLINERPSSERAKVLYFRSKAERSIVYQDASAADPNLTTTLISSFSEKPNKACRWDAPVSVIRDRMANLAPNEAIRSFERDPWSLATFLTLTQSEWFVEGWGGRPVSLLNPTACTE
jgi:hypothetical protein